MTFTEARRRIKPKTQVTYASVATKKTVSRAVQTEAGAEILPSHLELITTNRTTRSKTQKPSTSRLSHTDPSSKHLSESKPSSVTKTTQPSVSAKPTNQKHHKNIHNLNRIPKNLNNKRKKSNPPQ